MMQRFCAAAHFSSRAAGGANVRLSPPGSLRLIKLSLLLEAVATRQGRNTRGLSLKKVFLQLQAGEF